MFAQSCLFMNQNVPEGGYEEGRRATPSGILIFDPYNMKTLCFKFDHDTFSGFKMPRLSIWDASHFMK